MRKLLFLLLLIPAISFAQGTATNIRNGSSLPTACANGDIFYKTTAPIGVHECSVPGNPGTWRRIYSSPLVAADVVALFASGSCSGYLKSTGGCDAGGSGTPGGSDTQVQFNNVGAFGGDSQFTWNSSTHTLGIGDGSSPTIIDILGTAGAPSNPAANHCAIKFNLTTGKVAFVNSSGGDCGPSGSAPVSSVFGRTGAVTATSGDYSEAQISFSDITTNNSSTSNHGYLKKLDNTATHYMDGTGNWSTPAGGGSVPGWVSSSPDLTPGSPNAMDDEFDAGSLNGTLWTWLNQGSATWTQANSLGKISYTAGGGNEIRGITQPRPTAPYEIEVKMTNDQPFSGTEGGGICIYDSSNSKVIIFVQYPTTLIVNYMSSLTAFSSQPFTTNLNARPIYLKFKDDGTNFIFSASYTGTQFFTVLSASRTALLTTSYDRIGVCGTSASSANSVLDAFDFFRRTL